MTLASQITSDVTVFLNTSDFAQAGTYNGAAVTALDLQPLDQELGKGQFNRTVKPGILHVKSSDVAAPAINDQVAVGGVTWVVVGVPGSAERGLWRLEVQTEEKPII